ncbi:MAG: hypothetical protein ABJE10_16805 [bacterium]
MTSHDSRRDVEWLCVRECLRFSLRHRRYLAIALALYGQSIRKWKETRIARYGFCFLQLFDDIMDGDRPTSVAADVVAGRTIAAWANDDFHDDDPLSRLGAAFSAELETLPLLPGDHPRQDVLALLRLMRTDARRIAHGNALAEAQIKAQLRNTFHHSLNIMLISTRVHTRARDVPDLVELMGWRSVTRDLDEDLQKGLVNIPADVVTRVQASGGKLTSRHPEVQRWLIEERLAVRAHVDRSALTLEALTTDDPRAARLLGVFHRSIERHVK